MIVYNNRVIKNEWEIVLKGHKITAWRWITEKDDKNISPKEIYVYVPPHFV